MKVWAFNRVDNLDVDSDRVLIYESVKNGKSRFGWSYKDEHNLLGETWSDCHSKQLFLLQIEVGDWIVHINTPSNGKCVAAQVTAKYAFDEGLKCRNSEIDFRHVIEVDKNTVIEFDRQDKNILPNVNLYPMYRYQRVKAADDFLISIENIKQDKVVLQDGERREIYHLKNETDKLLKEITHLLHKTHRRKNLEHFLAEVFSKISNVIHVKENGSVWGRPEYGADLIVTMRSSIGNIDFQNILVVQVKSFGGECYDLKAVKQIKMAIKEYGASAGMIITTAQRTEPLEIAIQEAFDEIGCPIDLLAGDDVAKFVLKYAPDLLFRL